MPDYSTFVGIDVAKKSLDIHLIDDTQKQKEKLHIENSPKAVKAFAKRLAKRSGTCLVVMEATGLYDQDLDEILREAGVEVAVVNPRWIRDFAKSAGRAAKTDSLDAETIALYAVRMSPAPTPARGELPKRLKELLARRRQLVKMRTAERNHLERLRDKQLVRSVARVEKFLSREIDAIDLAVEKLLDSDAQTRRKIEVMTSVAGVGKKTAAAVLGECPELGTLSRAQAASLAGVAPFNRDSGAWRGHRSIGGGRFYLRSALYMASLSASRFQPVLSRFYQSLRSRGKAPKVALTAVMRRLIVLLNALLKTNTPWNPNHQTTTQQTT